jgi:glycosyltransferase involved in cell wall biosynthesis
MSHRLFNILYLSSFGNLRGGAQVGLFHLVANLDKTAFCPHVNLPTEGSLAKKLRVQGIDVTVFDLPKAMNFRIQRNFKALYELLKLSTEYKIDLIHTDGPRNTFYAGLVAKIKRIPLVWHVRVSHRDKYDRLLYHLSSKIILVANSLRSRFGWVDESHKFATIYNGIDLSEFKPQRPIPHVRHYYGIRNSSLLICVVARIEHQKGQKYLIEACGKLKAKLQDFHLLLVGDIVDSAYLKECKDIAEKLGIQERITFTGQQENVSQVLSAIDIFVLPSLSEGFPRSVIEAMGARKPVIVTDVGGCSEAVEDYVSGFIVPAKDLKELSDKINLLGTDKELRSKVGKEARIRVEEMFSIQKNVKQIERAYREILGENDLNTTK